MPPSIRTGPLPSMGTGQTRKATIASTRSTPRPKAACTPLVAATRRLAGGMGSTTPGVWTAVGGHRPGDGVHSSSSSSNITHQMPGEEMREPGVGTRGNITEPGLALMLFCVCGGKRVWRRYQ